MIRTEASPNESVPDSNETCLTQTNHLRPPAAGGEWNEPQITQMNADKDMNQPAMKSFPYLRLSASSAVKTFRG